MSGRTFQREGTARAKAQRRKQVWCAWGIAGRLSWQEQRARKVRGGDKSGQGGSYAERDGTALNRAGDAVFQQVPPGSWWRLGLKETRARARGLMHWAQVRKDGQYQKRRWDVTRFWVYFEGQGIRIWWWLVVRCEARRGVRMTPECLAFIEIGRKGSI